MTRWLFISLIFLFNLQAYAFEDCIVTSENTITNINIEDNSILEVYPLVTIMNDKNILFFHPLKSGNTSVSVSTKNTDEIVFDVEITEDKTNVSKVDGFETLVLDNPPESFILDSPPVIQKEKGEE